MNPLLKLLSGLLGGKVVFDVDDPEGWSTVNGAHIPLGEGGEAEGKVGEKIKDAGHESHKKAL